jgi:SNF2 family DNA or RNA helicase
MKWLLKGKPYTVQSKALEKCNARPGFGYFMEMGLGKTAVVLAEFTALAAEDKVDGLVVVCPNSIKSDWHNERQKWGVPHPSFVWPDLPDNAKPFMLVMNYEAFSSGVCAGYSYLMQKAKTFRLMVVLDESIQIKNYKSKKTKHLLALAPFLTFKRVLSGAPITQGPHDLWAQLRFLGAVPINYHAFRYRFCKMGGFMAKQVIGARNEEELSQLIDDWGFRAKKADWTDLPPKLPPITRFAEMTTDQKKIYKEMEKTFIAYIHGERVESNAVITQLQKLQQITSGFIIPAEGAEPLVIEAEPPKYRELLNILGEVQGKVLVFAHYRYTILSLMKLMSDFNPAILIGGMEREAIDAEKLKFNKDPSCRLFIIQTTTGKYGHTLLGNVEGGNPDNLCSTTVFYENSYSLDNRVQAEDRNHRHGQTRAVQYIDLVSSKTDTAAIKALQRKESVADAIVNKKGELR